MNKYLMQVKFKNIPDNSFITIYSDELFTQDEMNAIVMDSFNRYRGEVVIYDRHSMLINNLITKEQPEVLTEDYMKKTYTTDKTNKFEIYKYIDTNTLSKKIVEDNSLFSLKSREVSHKFDTIVIDN